MNSGGGLQDVGTGRRVGAEVHIEQNFGVAAQNISTLRIRYFNIQPDRFSWTADRSNDGRKTWITDDQQIEARRIGPPRHSLRSQTRNKRANSELRAICALWREWAREPKRCKMCDAVPVVHRR